MTIAKQLNIREFPFIIKDDDGNVIYLETANGYWRKHEFNSNGKEIYYENSDGSIINKRPKTVEGSLKVSLEEIAKKFGIRVEQLLIKK